MALQVAGNLFGKALHQEDRHRPGADQAHVAFEDVEELGQLIETEPAQHPANRGAAVIVRPGDHRTGLGFGVGNHGPELIDGEPVVVQPDPRLAEEHRPAGGGQLDQDRDHEHHGGGDDQDGRAHEDIDGAFQHGRRPPQAASADADQRQSVDRIDRGSGTHDFEKVGDQLELSLQVVARLDQVQDLVVGRARHRNEHLVDAHLRDQLPEVTDSADDGSAGEGGTHLQPVVEHAGDVVAILRKHRHPLNQQLAARAGADHQHPFGADAATPQSRLVLPEQIALDRHQDRRDDDGVNEGEPGIFEPAIQRHAGQRQHRGQGGPAAHGKHLVDQGAAPPGPVLLVDGEREQVDGDDDRDGRHVGTKGERLSDHLRDPVEVISVFVREDDGGAGDQRIPRDQGQRQPVRAAEDGGGGGHRLRCELAAYRPIRLGHRPAPIRSRIELCAAISMVSSNGSKRTGPRRCNARRSKKSAKCGFLGRSEPCR